MSKSGLMVMRSFGVVVCVALVAVACSSGAGSSTPPLVLDATSTAAPGETAAPTTIAIPTTTEAPATTLSAEQQAEAELEELAMAYLTYENNEFEEGRTEPWPKLSLTTGSLLDRLTSLRQNDIEDDLFAVGALLNPVLLSVDVSGGVARIDFCSDDATYRIYGDGSEYGSVWEGGAKLGYLSAVVVEDEWLLEEFIVGEESCEAADYS